MNKDSNGPAPSAAPRYKECKSCPLNTKDDYNHCTFPECIGGWQAYAEYMEEQLMAIPTAAPDDGMVMLSKQALGALLTEARQERAEKGGHRVPDWDVPPEQRTAAGITVLDVPCSTHLAMNCPRCYPPRGDSR